MLYYIYNNRMLTEDTMGNGAGTEAATTVQEALAQADDLCRERGVRLTPTRELVLTLLHDAPSGLKAYQILEQVQAHKPRARPPTVYRALHFLVAHGLVHRIRRLNAFKVCTYQCHQDHEPALFLVCPHCDRVTELESPQVIDALGGVVGAAGHRLEGHEIEFSAVCPGCLQHH